jgi:predicted metal-dependent RNase
MAVYSSKKSPEKELIDSLQKVSVTHGLVVRGPQIDFLHLLETLEQDFPELFVVYQTSSTRRLWIKRGEDEVAKQ